MDRDFEIGGRKFRLGKMDAFRQFHVVRRIGPILSDLLPALKDGVKNPDLSNLSESEKLDGIAKFVTPIMSGLSRLSDADAELVLYSLLGSVEMQQALSGNWMHIATKGANPILMVQDLELPVLLQIAGRAFVHNLAGFFSALPQQ